jgi:hypothetical protein
MATSAKATQTKPEPTESEEPTTCPIHYTEWNSEPTQFIESCPGCRKARPRAKERTTCPIHYNPWNDWPTMFSMSCPGCRATMSD